MFTSICCAWRRLFTRRRWERDMEEELRFHIDARVADLVARGVPAESAARQARVEFGGMEQQKELCRETSLLMRSAGELRRNLRYSLRSLKKSPGFTMVGVLSLGLGIGANIATFSLIERLMLTELPVRDPGGLYLVGTVGEHGFQSSQSYVHLETIRTDKDLFSGVLAWSSPWPIEVRIGERLEQPRMSAVSGSYFPLLGVQAELGRTFTEADDCSGCPNVAMLSHPAWQQLFGEDPRALEHPLKIGGVPFQLIGVTPAGFSGTEVSEPAELFIPIHCQTNFNKNAITAEGMMWLHTMVRLQPGLPVAVARAVYGKRSLERSAPLRRKMGRLDTPKPPTLEPAAHGYSTVRNEFSKPLAVLMSLVVIVLLIACANLSTLLFVRGARKARETSLRLALGASHGQLVREWMTECMILAAAGGLLGMILARWIVDLLIQFVGPAAGKYLRFETSPKIVIFTVSVTLAAGFLFGLLPSFRASVANPGAALKESQPTAVGRRKRLWRWVLAAQVAASLVLVTGAVLFARTLRNLSTASVGFARSEIVWARVKFSREAPIRPAQLHEAVDRLRQSPMLAAVSMGRLPMSGGGWNWATVPGYVPRPEEDNIVYFSTVLPGYFKTLQIEMLRGRDFEERDRVWPPKTIVVSESFAKHYFGGANPVGAKVSVIRYEPPSEIIGVVRDTPYSDFRERKHDVAFYALPPEWSEAIVGRLKRPQDKDAALAEIRTAIAGAAPKAQVETGTIEDLIRRSIRRDRLVGELSGVFGLLGLIIAAIGLYGALSYEVSRRTREIGIRIALGARPRDIVGTTLKEVVIILAVGIVSGIPACIAGSQFVRSLLFGVSPTDLGTFAAAAAVLSLTALAAGLIPAHRATQLDPTRALRDE